LRVGTHAIHRLARRCLAEERGRFAAYCHDVRATAWHNGGSPTDASGYGIKFSETDRDAYFRREWTEVVIEFDGIEATIALTPSFWRACSELRSAAIGRRLLQNGDAPWRKGQRPASRFSRRTEIDTPLEC
jgi:hypothetical protein